jgi:hypothetical protein
MDRVAKIDQHGTKYWRDHCGKMHRDDGPAIEWPNGDKWWYHHGKRHRANGPAIERRNGSKEWWQYGNRHRNDGPAIEWPSGHKEWWLFGTMMSFDRWLYKVDMSDEGKVMLKLQYG